MLILIQHDLYTEIVQTLHRDYTNFTSIVSSSFANTAKYVIVSLMQKETSIATWLYECYIKVMQKLYYGRYLIRQPIFPTMIILH